MKKFMKELFANRLGIVLAALNVCYFVAQAPVKFAFSRGDVNCSTHNYDAFFWVKSHYAQLMFDINLPALLAGFVQGRLMHAVLPDLCVFTHAKFQIISLAVIITFQWLFIGWTAKTIARIIRPAHD